MMPANGTSEIAAGGGPPLASHAPLIYRMPDVLRRGVEPGHRSTGEGPPAPRNDSNGAPTKQKHGLRAWRPAWPGAHLTGDGLSFIVRLDWPAPERHCGEAEPTT